jgi:Flp pilus assembly protein TadG
MPMLDQEVGGALKQGFSRVANARRSVLRCMPPRVMEFLDDRRGAVAVLSALSLPVLLGFAGLAIEVNYWYLEKRKLQEAADSGALAGAYEYRANSSISSNSMAASVTAAVGKSGYSALTTQTVNRPPTSGTFAVGGVNEDHSAVEVTLTETYSTLFVSLFGMQSLDISTRAVAVSGGVIGKACVLALERDLCSADGIQFQGSLDLDLVKCSVHSNDSCGDGVNFNGNPDVLADCLTTGGMINGSSSNLVLTGCSGMEPLAGDVGDPFAKVVVPNVSSESCQDANGVVSYLNETPWWQHLLISSAHAAANGNGNGNSGGGGGGSTTTFTPGRYCGDMNFGSDNVLDSGVYFVEGDFFENGGTVTGSSVILVYMNSDSTFDFRGNGDLAITAPTADEIKANNSSSTGDGNGDGIEDNAFELISDAQADIWAGLVLFNTSTNGLGNVNNCSNKINGTSGISAVGAIYFPNTCITFTGNDKTASNGECLQVIAGNIALSGNAGLDSTGCDPSYNIATFATMVGLVE